MDIIKMKMFFKNIMIYICRKNIRKEKYQEN